MAIDFDKVRVGDTVYVQAVVADTDVHDTEKPVRVEIAGTRAAWVKALDVVGHISKPREFAIGDKVVDMALVKWVVVTPARTANGERSPEVAVWSDAYGFAGRMTDDLAHDE
ncbi:MAG: hypothetical protein ACYDD1_02330 [Caulobacteraceae bacterium]